MPPIPMVYIFFILSAHHHETTNLLFGPEIYAVIDLLHKCGKNNLKVHHIITHHTKKVIVKMQIEEICTYAILLLSVSLLQTAFHSWPSRCTNGRQDSH